MKLIKLEDREFYPHWASRLFHWYVKIAIKQGTLSFCQDCEKIADKPLRVGLERRVSRQGIKSAIIISLLTLHQQTPPLTASNSHRMFFCNPNCWLLLEFWVGDLGEAIEEDYKPLKGKGHVLFIPLFLLCSQFLCRAE